MRFTGMGCGEVALALFPHVCGRCGREFAGKDLRELTVHHRDHDHGDNPPDGSNWELLCVYCHDQEHALLEQRGHYGAAARSARRKVRRATQINFRVARLRTC